MNYVDAFLLLVPFFCFSLVGADIMVAYFSCVRGIGISVKPAHS